jgi:hypothetical protein
MSQWHEEKARTAVQSMFRVRAAESAPDAQGIKSVWHQGARGADLLSYVDAKGIVNEQALTLLDEHLLWRSRGGLRSGVVGGAVGATGGKATEAITFDRTLSRERVQRMARALASYRGDDKYILHIRSVVTYAANGMASDDSEAQVTNVVTAEQLSHPEGDDGSLRRSPRKGRLLVLGAMVAIAVLGVSAYLLAG